MPRSDHEPIDPALLRCSRCGLDLRETPLGGCCPECGTPVARMLRRSSTGEFTPGEKVVFVLILAGLIIGLIALLASPMLYR